MKNILKISSVLVTLALLVSIVLVNGLFASAGDKVVASWSYNITTGDGSWFYVYDYKVGTDGTDWKTFYEANCALTDTQYFVVNVDIAMTSTEGSLGKVKLKGLTSQATLADQSCDENGFSFRINGPFTPQDITDPTIEIYLGASLKADKTDNGVLTVTIYDTAAAEESEEESVVIEESEEESAPAPIEESEEESAPAPIEESEEESAPAPIEESEEESVEESAPAEESEEESEMIKTNIITITDAIPEQFRTIAGTDLKVSYPIGKAAALKDGEYYEIIGSAKWIPAAEGGWGGDLNILNGETPLFDDVYLDGNASTPISLIIDSTMVSEGDQLTLFCIEDAHAYGAAGDCALIVESLEVNLYTFPEEEESEEESVEESAPIEESEDVSVEESEEPVAPEYKNFIKNGDFSDGLNNWNTNGDVTVDEDGVLNFGGSSSFTQKIAVDPTKTYTLTGIADVKSATEMWNYAYLRGTYYDASGAKLGSKMDIGGALLQYNASKGELNKSTELPVELNKQFGAEASSKIPEGAAYVELSFESSTDGVVWTLDDLCLIDGETLAGEDEESEEESDAEESTEPGEESTEPGEESTVPGDESEDVSEEEPSEDESADTSIDESGDTSDIEVLAGDAIPDGVLDMKDVLAMRKVIAKMAVEGFNAANADFNGDGALDMKDVLALRKTIAGIEL